MYRILLWPLMPVIVLLSFIDTYAHFFASFPAFVSAAERRVGVMGRMTSRDVASRVVVCRVVLCRGVVCRGVARVQLRVDAFHHATPVVEFLDKLIPTDSFFTALLVWLLAFLVVAVFYHVSLPVAATAAMVVASMVALWRCGAHADAILRSLLPLVSVPQFFGFRIRRLGARSKRDVAVMKCVPLCHCARVARCCQRYASRVVSPSTVCRSSHLHFVEIMKEYGESEWLVRVPPR
jgi:hypothetical protein